MDNHPIGVFDSGVGGLSVLSEIKKLLPQENFIYLADQAYLPYGTKSQAEICTRALLLTKFLKTKKVKIIVVACNTATVAAIETLRKTYSTPIIGIVPVIKTAAEKTKTRKIAVFATPATIKSRYITALIKEFAQGITVYKDGATGLEVLIEKGNIADSDINIILNKHLLPLRKGGVDVIALGCTHYPFLKSTMQQIVGKNILILDSGGAIARQTKRILEARGELSLEKSNKDWYYTTGDTNAFEKVAKKLTGKNISAQHINL